MSYHETYFTEESLREKISEYEIGLKTLEKIYENLKMLRSTYVDKSSSIRNEIHTKETELQSLYEDSSRKVCQEKEKQLRIQNEERKDNNDLSILLNNKKDNLKQEWVEKRITLSEYKEQLKAINEQASELSEHNKKTPSNFIPDHILNQIETKVQNEYKQRISKLSDEIRKLQQKDQSLIFTITRHHSRISLENEISSMERNVEHQRKVITDYKSMKTYPLKDAVKYNCLGYGPKTGYGSSDEVEYESMLIEDWRIKYEEYNKKHNIFPQYFSLIRLFEEYYKGNNEEGKIHPYPEVVAHCQDYPEGMLESIIEQIHIMGMEKELIKEIAFLKKMIETGTTPHKILIKKCNIHYLDVFINTGDIKMKCTSHKDCFYKSGKIKCSTGYHAAIRVNNKMREKMGIIFYFNIEMTLNDILPHLYVQTFV